MQALQRWFGWFLRKGYSSRFGKLPTQNSERPENLQSIAFPCISRGIHRFPAETAAEIALAAILAHSYGGVVILCCLMKEDFYAYNRLLKEELR